jgi:hypothetical protein
MIVQVLDIGGKRPDTVQLIDLFVVSRRCRDDKTMTAAGNVLWTTIFSPSSRSYIRHGRCMMCAMRLLCMQCPIQLSTRIQVNLEFVTRKSQHKITFYEPAFADQKHEGQQRIFEQPGPHHLHSRARASESNSISHQRHCFTVKSSYRCCTGRDHSCDFH